ncbi:SRPBCC domain-containing protein, partial [Mycobacterium tuberculosis]|nr:SRPBCC domain-containing protein [Mycobacterium tuberculosis]
MRLDGFLTGTRKVDSRVEGTALLLSRWFDAPRDQVFSAWTEARHIMRWWGPHGSQVADCVSEPRAGGRYR